jgi:hypothetical protein
MSPPRKNDFIAPYFESLKVHKKMIPLQTLEE